MNPLMTINRLALEGHLSVTQKYHKMLHDCITHKQTSLDENKMLRIINITAQVAYTSVMSKEWLE